MPCSDQSSCRCILTRLCKASQIDINEWDVVHGRIHGSKHKSSHVRRVLTHRLSWRRRRPPYEIRSRPLSAATVTLSTCSSWHRMSSSLHLRKNRYSDSGTNNLGTHLHDVANMHRTDDVQGEVGFGLLLSRVWVRIRRC
jgi:hypothetical protein